jgi:hypothetical protein
MIAPTASVRVRAPGPGDDLGARFARLAPGALAPALDLDVTEIDELARVDAAHPLGLRTDDAAVMIDYLVEASAFHACRDLHHHGRAMRTLRGRTDGDDWVFPVHAPSPVRDGRDEF